MGEAAEKIEAVAQHTPGPWEWMHGYATDHIQTVRRAEGEYRGAYGPAKIICTFPPENARLHEANARLIAAAPDMLKALKQIHFYETVRDPNRGELFLGALRAVERAIAKAEGSAA